MIILFILILLLFETIAVLRGRVSPLSVFIGLWIVIFVLYSLQLYNIYSVEESTIIYLFLGICFFVFGYTISDCFRNKRIWLSGCITDISDKTDGTIMLKVIVGITIIASIPQLIERIRYVMTSGIALLSIKDSLIRGELASGSILQTVWVKPLSVIIIMLSTYFLLNDIGSSLTTLDNHNTFTCLVYVFSQSPVMEVAA